MKLCKQSIARKLKSIIAAGGKLALAAVASIGMLGCAASIPGCQADPSSCAVIPTPTITSISPNSARAGGAQFTLTVFGAGFTPFSEVNWNSAQRNTTFVGNGELTAIIGPLDIQSTGTADVTVVNSSNTSNVTVASNIEHFTIAAASGSIAPAALTRSEDTKPQNSESEVSPELRGRIVAVGIPGASAISAVGKFLPGGPIHDKPEFAAFTQPGRILDPVRILVASRSNFGAPVANSDQMEGSFISIDPTGKQTLIVPQDFAADDGQASAFAGRVQMFTAQSSSFRNGINNPSAASADFTGASNPLGLSINNAFGRLWPANAPYDLGGIGSSTILDPDGLGLAGAPDALAGGAFAGDLTSRLPKQLIPGGLNSGAVATAFLGRSPDGSKRAVFAVVLADGSLVQEHTVKGVDGLAPPRTIASLLAHDLDIRSAEGMATEQTDVTLDPEPQQGPDQGRNDDEDISVSPRCGALFNWEPARILYVSEPFQNRIAVLDITDDDEVFHVAAIRYFTSQMLDEPIDMAPVNIETLDPNFAGNTTLDNNSDFYIANRGNNTIVRMRQDGSIVAVRKVHLEDGSPLGRTRLNGIATSPDGKTIWVTVTGMLPGLGPDGAVLELPAF